MMMNKKGLLIKNVLGVIIAVLGIGLLFFVSFRIWFAVTIDEETASATASIDKIYEEIEIIEDGEKVELDLQGFKQSGKENNIHWGIRAWNLDDPYRPEKCFLSNCICVCKGETIIRDSDCQENGICREVEGEITTLQKYFFQRESINALGQSSYIRELGDRNFIKIPTNLYKVTIEKNESGISVTGNQVDER